MQQPIQHPPWCVVRRCEAALGGSHSSEPTDVAADHLASVRGRVRIWRRHDDPGPGRIELALADHDHNAITATVARKVGRFDLSPRQAEHLGALLLDAAAHAIGGSDYRDGWRPE